MGIIRKLPQDVVEKIAAGEVVERPASVVKELVENAIDAGARFISVDVQDGGKKRIIVIDDGSGMDENDLSSCVLRHATSKIKTEHDLWNIRTFGFRGEAIAAIGAVSKLVIESCVNKPSALEGARIEVDGGAVSGPMPAGCAHGTKIVVSDLFYNVPARLKFLRSSYVEYGHIYDVIATTALAYPNVRFELSADGKQKFVSNVDDVKGCLSKILGSVIADKMIAFSEEGGGIRVHGRLSSIASSSRKNIHIFINKRPVYDKILTHAIMAGFHETLTKNEYPAAVLWLDIDPSILDVNVHPTKREVKFANGSAVHDFVKMAVRKALQTCHALASGGQASCACPEFSRGVMSHASDVENAINRYEYNRMNNLRQEAGGRRQEKPLPHPNLPLEKGKGFVSHASCFVPHTSCVRLIGQLGRTYIVCEDTDSTLVLIDQHAAHERLRFDELSRQYSSGKIAEQRLLLPERIELGEKGGAYLLEHKDILEKCGFEIEAFGGGSLIVKSVPSILGETSLNDLFKKMIDELEDYGQSTGVDEEIFKIFALVACHAQVRAGDGLSHEEMNALIKDIQKENITHCPHGRPAVVKIDKSEIEKWFKRRE